MQAMTLDDLIAEARHRLDDGPNQPRHVDSVLARYFSEAEDEACVRARLLLDDSTDEITLVNYIADTPTRDLHESVFEITNVRNEDTGDQLFEITEDELYKMGRWREHTAAEPTHYMVKVLPNDSLRVTLYPSPTIDTAVRFTVHRTPQYDLEMGTDEPEIAPKNHMALVDWVVFRCSAVRDPDLGSNQTNDALTAFERFFGLRDTAQQRRVKRMPVNISIKPRRM